MTMSRTPAVVAATEPFQLLDSVQQPEPFLRCTLLGQVLIFLQRRNLCLCHTYLRCPAPEWSWFVLTSQGKTSNSPTRGATNIFFKLLSAPPSTYTAQNGFHKVLP